MAELPRTTKRLILANRPTAMPVLSGPDATFKMETVPLPELQEGEMLCKVLYFSSDAGQRGFIQSTVSDDRLYVPPVHVGTPMRSGVVAQVLETKSPKIKQGDMVMDYHRGSWSEHIVLSDAQCQLLAPLPNNLPYTHYLGAFGGSGMTAFTGLVHAGGVTRDSDQTVVVSAAAGATGSMAVQIAARILRAKRVVGIAGSDAKCEWVVKQLGAHACVNYKSPTFLADLAAATPDEVDVYFDNVGGAVLDAMLPRMKRMGRGTVAVCGAVGQYNTERPMELRNWCEVFSARITIRGFIMLDYLEHVPAAMQELAAAIVDGRLNVEDIETVVEAPLEKQPEVWCRLFSGESRGKLVTKLVHSA